MRIVVRDLQTPAEIEAQAKYFAQLDAAEKRGGCFFAAAGDEARLDLIEAQRLREDGEPEYHPERKTP